ncbi:ferredoxin [Phlegmacium glaucopus]|nr:ferredoxin [Phlegmacium glaucopus]
MFKTQINACIRPIIRCSEYAPGFMSKMSLTSPRCFHASTASARRLRTTRTRTTGSNIRSTSPPSPWIEWFSSNRIRGLHSSAPTRHGHITRPPPGTGIKVHFKDSNGSLIKTVEVNEGDDILSIAHEHDIDLEGACEGSVACSTCHVILPEEYYNLLPEPEDDENDMLDMAFGLTDTSRLGCQVKLTRELDGITCTLPSATRNMFVDGKKASH